MSQHSKSTHEKKSNSLLDCVDITVKVQQYIRDIIVVCRHHPLVKEYPTPGVTNAIYIASK